MVVPKIENCYMPVSCWMVLIHKILVNMEVSKSIKTTAFYLNCPSLHSLPHFVSRTKNILVGSGQYVGVLFVIPVVINLYGHRFEAYTLVSWSHDNIDMIMGIKNMYEIERVISTGDLCLCFLNRSIPVFPKTEILLKPREQIHQS